MKHVIITWGLIAALLIMLHHNGVWAEEACLAKGHSAEQCAGLTL